MKTPDCSTPACDGDKHDCKTTGPSFSPTLYVSDGRLPVQPSGLALKIHLTAWIHDKAKKIRGKIFLFFSHGLSRHLRLVDMYGGRNDQHLDNDDLLALWRTTWEDLRPEPEDDMSTITR